MSMLNSLLDAAFAHPRGLLGRLGAMIMARSEQRNEWVVSQLDVQPRDFVLEVGFGPGTVIEMLAQKAVMGCVIGVDASPLMAKQASERNAEAIDQKRVLLEQGLAEKLPLTDHFIDKALSINSVHVWSDSLAGVEEIHRVLKPGGLIALAIQPVWVRTDNEVREIGAGLEDLLTKAGFRQTRLEYKPMKPMATVCALGYK